MEPTLKLLQGYIWHPKDLELDLADYLPRRLEPQLHILWDEVHPPFTFFDDGTFAASQRFFQFTVLHIPLPKIGEADAMLDSPNNHYSDDDPMDSDSADSTIGSDSMNHKSMHYDGANYSYKGVDYTRADHKRVDHKRADHGAFNNGDSSNHQASDAYAAVAANNVAAGSVVVDEALDSQEKSNHYHEAAALLPWLAETLQQKLESSPAGVGWQVFEDLREV